MVMFSYQHNYEAIYHHFIEIQDNNNPNPAVTYKLAGASAPP